MWPRRKNTRGGEAEDTDTDESAIEARDMEPELPTARKETSQEQHIRPSLKHEDSLEARMAVEGRKLLSAEGRGIPQQATTEGARRRNIPSRNTTSTEDFSIPGRFE
jgi:hypothetical protein